MTTTNSPTQTTITPIPRGRCARQLMTALVVALTLSAACEDDEVIEPNTAVEQDLRRVLDSAVVNPDALLPGAVLHYRHPDYAAWSGAAGLGNTEPEVAMRPHDKFRAGSIVKPFLATVALQHVEAGDLSLDHTLPTLLPASVTDRIANAQDITLRMLLGHTSGIPEFLTPDVIQRVVADPEHVWTPDEYIDIAAELPAAFAPGSAWQYSNTNYTVLGLVLEQAARQSWRDQVRERIFRPLGLDSTSLPEPGDISITGDFAHGYQVLGEQVVDLTFVDPSMADAAGGHAMITTGEDLGTFLDALLAGELFDDPATLGAMTTLIEAPNESGLPHFYGLGIESYVTPDGTELIGHSGSTAGYATMMFRVSGHDTTIVASVNTDNLFTNALQVLFPAVEVVVADIEPKP